MYEILGRLYDNDGEIDSGNYDDFCYSFTKDELNLFIKTLKIMKYFNVKESDVDFWIITIQKLYLLLEKGVETERLLNDIDITDPFEIERLIIGVKILNTFSTNTHVNELMLEQLAIGLGIEFEELLFFLPDIRVAKKNGNLTLYSIKPKIKKQTCFEHYQTLKQTKFSYSLEDYDHTDGTLFTSEFLFLLHIIAGRRKMISLFLERNHSWYSYLKRFGLKYETGKKVFSDLVLQLKLPIEDLIDLYYYKNQKNKKEEINRC